MGVKQTLKGLFGKSRDKEGVETEAAKPQEELSAQLVTGVEKDGTLILDGEKQLEVVELKTEERPQEQTVESVRPEVTRQVENVLTGNPAEEFRYFMKELISKNVFGVNCTVNISELAKDKVEIIIPGRLKNQSSAGKLVINSMLKFGKKAEIKNENTLDFGNFKIESPWATHRSSFTVCVKSKLKDKDLEIIKDYFENIYLPELILNEAGILDSQKIKDILELNENSIVIIDNDKLEITLSIDNEIVLDDKTLEIIAIYLNNTTKLFGVKYISLYGEVFGKDFIVNDLAKNNSFKLKTNYKDGKLTINIEGHGGQEFEIRKEFVEQILKKFIFLLKEDKSSDNAIKKLEEMGVIVYEKNPDEEQKTLEELYVQEGFMGYEDVKESIATDVIFPWQNKDEYERISKEKFPNLKDIIPNAALFEGPPGTGKTTQAKIIGKYLGYPFVYIPIGKILSKRYGESEKRLSTILELCGKVAEENGGVVIMIDEIDEIGKNRDNSNEATARVTGVLLKKLDGMEQLKNILLIGSTNRKTSMDAALLSRFGEQVFFRLPNEDEIRHIFGHYIPDVKDIDEEIIIKLKGNSGRDIKNIAQTVSKKYIETKLIKKEEPDIVEIIKKEIEKIGLQTTTEK